MRAYSLTLRSLLLVVSLLPSAVAFADSPLRIGILVPGRDTGSSAEWNELLAARAWEQQQRESLAGIELELVYRDGGTTAGDTVGALAELVRQEKVHAVVCCVTPASAAASRMAAGELPLLALARPGLEADPSGGPLLLPPNELTLARAIAWDARALGGGLGLMTLDDDRGKAVAAALVAGLLEAGLPLTRAESYPAGSKVLTPEALLVAASEPAAVVVWGSPADSGHAIEALRARGFEGPIYLPWHLAQELPGGFRSARLRSALLAVPPVMLVDSIPPDHPNSRAVQRYVRALSRAYGAYGATVEGALIFDGLELLASASELALVYGVNPASVTSFRIALHDALVALSPLDGAAGSYDFDGRNPELALARGLMIATPEAGSLHPARH